MSTTRYSWAYRVTAVLEVYLERDGGEKHPIARVAERRGLPYQTLYKWVQQARRW